MVDFVGLGSLVLLIGLLGWLLTRAWRIKRSTLRWSTLIPLGLLTLTALSALSAAINGYSKFYAQRNNPVQQISVASSPEQLARGEELARACAGCHSSTADFPLHGQNFAAEGPPVGTLWASGLNAAHFRDWSDGEIIRAIREGVHRSGRSLLIMPSSAFHRMSDEDVQSIVAFIRQHEPNAPATPPTQLSLMGALLLNVAPLQTAQEPLVGPVVAPLRGPTAAYGDYLLSVGGCRDCHAGNLAGVPPGGPVPPGPNISDLGQRYSEEQFIRLFREGVKADGTPLGEGMPYYEYELFDDDDFRAILAYMQSIEPLPDN
jgi:mono/diheme cytochrome c family protein